MAVPRAPFKPGGKDPLLPVAQEAGEGGNQHSPSGQRIEEIFCLCWDSNPGRLYRGS